MWSLLCWPDSARPSVPDQDRLPRARFLRAELEERAEAEHTTGKWPTISELTAQVPPELRERWDYVMSLQPKTRERAQFKGVTDG